MTENMGKQIRAGRQRSALTQERLAETLGVTPQAVSKWERGESLPDIALLPELSAALGLTLDELFESSAETHLRRIQQRMENEPRMSLESFRQAEAQLRQDALETEYRPRCLTLLAELCNHMAQGFRQRAEEAAKEAMSQRQVDIVILDELNIVLATQMLPLEEVLDFLKAYQHQLEIITTGRGAPEELIKMADLVTDMSEVKHYFHKGVSSRLGIDH